MKGTDAFRVLVIVCLILAAAQASNMVQPAGKSFTPRFVRDGGPDAWGYRYVDNDTTGSIPGKPTYNWMDIRGVGTRVTGLSDDNTVGPFQMGFVFPLYWQNYTEIFVGSNGYLAFDDEANSAHPFPDVPATQRPNNLIAPLMADLDFTGLTGNRGCWYWTNAACDTFVLQCESIPFWNEPGTWNSFEIVLSKRDSAIAFQYRVQVGAPNGTTPGWLADNDVVGIENITGLTGLRYLCGATPAWNGLHSGLAVRFFPPATSSYQFTDVWAKYAMSDNSGGMFLYVAQPTYVWARFKNAGNQSASNVPVSAEIRQGNNPPVFQWSGTIPAMPVGYETTLTFGRCSLTTTADYTLKVKSALSGDQYLANDSILIEIRVVNYTFPTMLSYDVGTSGGIALNGFHGYAIKFIPPVYPTVIDTALFYFTGSAEPVTVLVYDDNGPRGSPGTLLASVAWTPEVVGGWSHCYLGGLNINIRSGGFYLGYTKNQGSMLLGEDILQPLSRQNWEYTGAWAPMRTNEFTDLKIRTRIRLGTAVHNAGVTEVLAPVGTLDSGQVVAPQAQIKNFGSFAESPNVTFMIPSTPPYLQTVTLANLGPNRDTLVAFPGWSARPDFGLVPRCSVYVASDVEPQNDTLSGAPFNVRYIDLGTVSVDRPRDTIEVYTAIAPKATVRNYGNTAENVVVRFSVPGTVYNQTRTVHLGVGVTDTVVFPVWTPPAGDYTGRCSTEHSLDMYWPNDPASAPFFVRHRDVVCSQILVPTDTADLGQSVNPQAYVRNDGNTSVTFDVRFDIDDGYTNTQAVNSLAPTENRLISFGPWTPTIPGAFNLRCSTRLDGDQANGNDRCPGSVFLRNNDAQTVAIIQPGDGDTLHEASQIVPRAIVRNNGNTVRLIPVRFAISDGYSNTQSISLAPGAEDTVDFALWTVSPGIQFQMKCSTRLDNDVVPDNDWQTATVLVGNSDCGCADVLAPAGTIEPGTDVTPSARIFSRAWDDEELEVQLVIRDAGGNAVYDETETAIVLAQGETLDHAFVQHWTANPAGSYTVQAWVKNIAGDHNQANDTASGACEVMHVESPDAGVTRIVFPTGVLDTGTAVSPIAVVRNFGPTSLSFRAWFRILDEGGSAVYSNNYLVSALPSGDSLALQFDEWLRPHAVGSYSTRCSTFVAGDVNTTNDTLGGLFSVVAAARDVGALEVIAPTGIVDTSAAIAPSARVRNNSNAALTCETFFIIRSQGGTVYNERLTLTLPADAEAQVDFAEWAKPHPAGDYSTRCSVWVAGDQNPANDVADSAFVIVPTLVDVGVVALATPVGEYDTFETVTPAATVRNFGTGPCGFQTSFWIADAGANRVYQAETVLTLAPGAELPVSFPVWPRPHALGNYTSHCSTSVSGDAASGNDTLSRAFTVVPWKPALWTQMASVPTGLRRKNVKDGGCLARTQDPGNDTGFVYALKGNSTYEFYRYNIATNIWVTRESIPAYNRLMKKKGVKKGATLVQSSNGKLYAAKGGGTLDYWEYDPARPWGARWTQKADIPYGTRKLREGSGAVAVEVNGVDYIYFLKGSSTCEFYRYDSNTDVWETMAYAPTGPLNKTYKNGSCLTGDFDDTLFVLKGSYNEFAAYSISGNNWMTRETMPRIAPPGTRKKKVKDGAGIAYQGRNVFGLKGGNTNEFWAYRCDERKWYLAPEMPLAGGTTKRVKGGGALAYGRDGEARALYAFRGNNTLQLWRYGPLPPIGYPMSATHAQKAIQEQSASGSSQFAFSVSPNPFTNATVVSYSLPMPGAVSLKLYDITGKLVGTLASGYQRGGSHSCSLLPAHYALANGVYLIKFESEDYTTTEKLIIE